MGVKNWLIIQRISAYNFGVRGSNPMKLCHVTGHKGDHYHLYTTFGGHRSLKIWEGKKRIKFGAILHNFQIWLQICQERVTISTRGHKFHWEKFLSRWKKIGELLFTNKKVIDADVDLPKFKIRRDFGQLQTLTTNMSGADRHAENR